MNTEPDNSHEEQASKTQSERAPTTRISRFLVRVALSLLFVGLFYAGSMAGATSVELSDVAECLGSVTEQSDRVPDWFRENWDKIFYFLYYIWSGYWWLILAGSLAIMIVIVAFCLLERQPVRLLKQIKEPDSKRQNPYTRAMNEMALKLGFRHCGWFGDRRRSFVYGATVTMWLSPDALTVALVCGGKMIGLDVKKTSLISKPVGGAVLMTADMIGDPDISGTIDQRELFFADMAELYELHKERLKEWSGKLQPFKRSSLFEEFEEWRRRRVGLMVDYGLAKWVGWGHKKWRYSIIGALQKHRAYRENWRAMKKQEDRFGKKAPGDT